jgi:hypothetical protein
LLECRPDEALARNVVLYDVIRDEHAATFVSSLGKDSPCSVR